MPTKDDMRWFKQQFHDQIDQHWFVLLRKISCNFVDRVPRIGSQTIHKITLSYMKEHEIRVFVQLVMNQP
jgi:hypothetical protein